MEKEELTPLEAKTIELWRIVNQNHERLNKALQALKEERQKEVKKNGTGTK